MLPTLAGKSLAIIYLAYVFSLLNWRSSAVCMAVDKLLRSQAPLSFLPQHAHPIASLKSSRGAARKSSTPLRWRNPPFFDNFASKGFRTSQVCSREGPETIHRIWVTQFGPQRFRFKLQRFKFQRSRSTPIRHFQIPFNSLLHFFDIPSATDMSSIQPWPRVPRNSCELRLALFPKDYGHIDINGLTGTEFLNSFVQRARA